MKPWNEARNNNKYMLIDKRYVFDAVSLFSEIQLRGRLLSLVRHLKANISKVQ